MSNIKIIKPHKYQQEIMLDNARFKIVACGRRFGKTELGKIVVAETVLKYREQAFWFAPVFNMASQIWREMKETFAPIISWKSEKDFICEFTTGGELRIFSGERFDNVRGLKPFRVIIDEAAMMPDSSIWYGAIRPSLMDKKGEAYFLSTPRGRNWFYDLYQLGKDPSNKDYKSWSMPSWKNSEMPKSEILEMLKLPDRMVRQEVLAEFLLDAGEVFRGVVEIAKGYYLTPYAGRFAMGIDLGRKNDFTVITVFDIQTRTMVDMVRFSKIDWPTQKSKIKEVYLMWNPEICQIEENFNGSIIEDLKEDGLHNVVGFNSNKGSKPEIIQKMSIAIANKTVTLLNDKDLVFEFQAYQLNMTEKGNLSYSAPSGFHDDIVISACIGFDAVEKGAGVFGAALPILPAWWSSH